MNNVDAHRREREYWTDVLAVRPDDAIARQVEASRAWREACASRKTGLLDQPYGEHERQRLDVFLPETSGSHPLLVFVHGGYWHLGHKNDWAFLAKAWNARGVAVAVVGYRLLPEVHLPDIADDISAALDHIEEHLAHWRLDARRAVVAGISAGAHLTAQALSCGTATLGRAAVLLSGVYDLRRLRGTTPGSVIGDTTVFPPGDISPLARVPRTDCKNLIAVGANETDAFKSQSRAMATHLTNFGASAPLHELPDTNHYTISRHLCGDAQGPVREFLDHQLLY